MDWDTYITDLSIPKNWGCTSYVNDELPSYQHNGLHIWIDSPDLEERKKNSKRIYGLNVLAPRFSIFNADGYNFLGHYEGDLLSTDDFQKVINFVDSYKFLEFEHEGVWITDPFMDASGRFAVCPTEHYGINLEYLCDIYEDYCSKQKIDCIDAQEYLFDPTQLTDKQHDWMQQFSVAWDRAQKKEAEE